MKIEFRETLFPEISEMSLEHKANGITLLVLDDQVKSIVSFQWQINKKARIQDTGYQPLG